ncbi:MAG: hypothetical protein HFF57_03845, partial [Lawsonibacter sp.]|nr:hypothetical protein [Lawsonibacter sp.]
DYVVSVDQVGTQEKSYAWIDLDRVKLTKLDADSQIEINKEGKKLEIDVKTGSLFFNVTEPLDDDETMNIAASTMIIGIRGTCGWVGENTAALLEGTVEVTAGEQNVTISAGEMAVLTEDKLEVKPLTASDVPAFVVEEIAGDDGLAQTVLDATGLNIPAYSMASYEDVLAEMEEEVTIIYTELIDFEQDGSPELLVIHRRDNSDGISIWRNGPDGPQHLHGWGSGTHTAETYSLVESDGKLFVRRLSYSGPYSDGDYGYFDEYCGPTAQNDGGRESWGMTDYLQINFRGNGSLKASWVKSHNDKGFVDLEGDYDYNVSYLDVQGKYTLVRELVSFEGENPS